MFGGAPPPLSKRQFDKYDADNSGKIDADEFKTLCYSLGQRLNDTELKLAMKMLDEDGDGEINYAEFKKWYKDNDRWGKLKLSPEQQEVMTQACAYFAFFDKDGNGTLDKNEFRDLHADLVKNKLTEHSYEDSLADLDQVRNLFVCSACPSFVFALSFPSFALSSHHLFL